MKNTNKVMFIFLIFSIPSIVMATVSDELKRFNKCYAIFVGERVKTSDPLWKSVETGAKSGTDACMEIFDTATLSNNGEISQSNGAPNEIGLKVLNNFLRFQKSQFQVPDYGSSLSFVDRHTRDVIDANESAYHFIYSLFSPNQKFSDIVTRDYSLRGIRHSAFPTRARSVLDIAMPELEQGSYKTVLGDDGINRRVPDDLSIFSPVLVETGKLMGLVRNDVKNEITNLAYIKFKSGSFQFNDYNVNQHIGGGAIGTQEYVLGNIGKEGFSNGGTGVFRRWGKHVMEDFLCRGLPALRTTDVLSEVIGTSKIAFRTGISCMACHASMDPLAAVLRNGRVGWTNDGNVPTRVKFFAVRTPTLPYAEMPKINNEGNFYQRPPNGRLYYRSYDGTLVHQEIVGPQELGEKMAETNDLYVCAAKRYYKFLTGITVDLADIGNMNTPEFTKGAEFQRKKVIQMGLDLKKHQSARLLIKNIIEQKAFIYPDQGV